MLDQATLKTSDVDLHFISAYSASSIPKSKMNPDKCLVRFGFLEAVVRCARDKFLKQDKFVK
jgi:hypothetical protein